MKTKGNTQPIRARRETAKKTLEAQLLKNTKPEKLNGKTTTKMIPLTEYDVKRINSEINSINNPRKKV